MSIIKLCCLVQVPLFQNTEIGFTKLLALSIKPVLFLSKEYVVRKGDIGSEVSACFLSRSDLHEGLKNSTCMISEL